MLTVVEMRFGSHLYGTATSASDVDFKAVHLPDARDILLGRVRHAVTETTRAPGATKNSADDVERESYSLQKFLALCADGQAVALDMLFAAPASLFVGKPHPLWREIQANHERLLSRQVRGFIGYCRTQANKYGIKGSRVADARAVLSFAQALEEKHGSTAKLGDAAAQVENFAKGRQHAAIVEIPQPSGVPTKHLEICNRKAPFTASIKNLREIADRLVREYGHRALLAEKNEGIDWKALSHAVRVGRQAIELLESGNVRFPRPEAVHLLAIKCGTVPYREVGEEIEGLLESVEKAAKRSSLPEQPDYEWIDAFVEKAYREVVCKESGCAPR